MCRLAVLGSQDIVVKCTAAIFFRTVDCNWLLSLSRHLKIFHCHVVPTLPFLFVVVA